MTLSYLLDENVDRTIDELIIIAETAFDDEYQDVITYLPVTK